MLRLLQKFYFFVKVLYYTFSTLQHNSYFFGAAISWATAFFEDILFQNSSFFQRSYFFQNSYFFRAKRLQVATFREQKFLQGNYFSEQLLSRRVIKISREKLPFRSRCFCSASTFPEKLHFGGKLIFQKSNIPHHLFFWRAAFLNRLLFQKTLSSIAFHLFRRATFLQCNFSEELLFHISFLSYASYLPVSKEVSSVPSTWSLNVGVLSCVSIIVQIRVIDKAYLIRFYRHFLEIISLFVL